jgi:membrane protease subunit HflK
MFHSLKKRLGPLLSLNDNRWGRNPDEDRKAQDGRRPNEGPPDLDQMWRDFNQRLARLFGSRNGREGGGPQRPDGRGANALVGTVVGVVVLVWLASGAFIVQEGAAGVVTTFGKYSYTAGPGFNWRWPNPIQNHQIENVSQIRTAEIGYRGQVRNKNPRESLMLTEDENIVDIQFAVQYTLSDPVKWLYTNREPNETVRQAAETAVREVVGRSKMDFVLYEGREKVANDVHMLIQKLVNSYNLGAQINNVTMQGVQPPEQVQAAFDDAVRAGQDRERAKNEGQAYANDVIPSARGKAARLLQDAEAYRSMVVENATGNAARFSQVVAEYQKAPAVTRDRMYLDTMQQIFTSASKVMIDAKSGSNLLYLPLDKLVAQTAANDAAVGSKSGVVHPQPMAPAGGSAVSPELIQPLEQVRQRDNRNRESSRDREIR